VHYTESIEIKGDVAAVWSNRAFCWLKMGIADKALVDADAAIKIDPGYAKAHFRRGVALYNLGRFREACEAYGCTLRLDPKNQQAKASLKLAEFKLQTQS